MKFVVEIPDSEVLGAYASDHAVQACQELHDAIDGDTGFLDVKVGTLEPLAAQTAGPSFEDWMREVREQAWIHHQISEAEANALGIDDPEIWRTYHEQRFSALDALGEYFGAAIQKEEGR